MKPLVWARTLATYNHWMNVRLYDAAASLSDERRKEDLGAFFKSIHGTLNHILLADRIWLGRFTDEPFIADSLDQELYVDFDELRREREATDRAIFAWLDTLTDRDFEGELSYTSMLKPEPRRYPLWVATTHFFNHQTHHRGQATTLLMQCGVDPGLTDLIWLPEVQPAGD